MKSRDKWKIEDIPFGIIALFTFLGIAALGFSSSLSKELRGTLILISSQAILASYSISIILFLAKRRKKKLAWKNLLQAANRFEKSAHNNSMPLSNRSLVSLASDLYSRMGYDVANIEKHWTQGYYLKLINPAHETELVKCVCAGKPLCVCNLCDLQNKMIAESAVRSTVWAPDGYTEAAASWCRGKSIQLLNIMDIQRLVLTAEIDAPHREAGTRS
jgi:hypothetical protein